MTALSTIQHTIHSLHLHPLLVTGTLITAGFFSGKAANKVRLPSIIGFMLAGVLFGPSVLDVLNESLKENLSFITDIALGFVAISIGIELSFRELKKQGLGIVSVILTESFLAFVLVTAAVFALTRDLPMSLIFGAVAPASAPAGTVAIIKEYNAKGPLTRALYSVVGFDDGLGIIIFGFASAFAKSLLEQEAGTAETSIMVMMGGPLMEIGLSFAAGIIFAIIFALVIRLLNSQRDIFILSFALILLSAGVCHMLHLSVILTNMVLGTVIVNTQTSELVKKIHHELSSFLPLLFVLFFVLAGANLHLAGLPSVGLVGLVYILARAGGLSGGAFIGASLGRMPSVIRKYLGMGILSQAGVAIGLALVVKSEFIELGNHGVMIGNMVITTVTATCIFFELIGPILTKTGLVKAGEIKVHKGKSS